MKSARRKMAKSLLGLVETRKNASKLVRAENCSEARQGWRMPRSLSGLEKKCSKARVKGACKG